MNQMVIAMSDISWIFDGIGTAIVTGLVGLLLGGTVGYKIGVKKKKIRQCPTVYHGVTQCPQIHPRCNIRPKRCTTGDQGMLLFRILVYL